MATKRRTYQFGPLEKRGRFLGMTDGQLLIGLAAAIAAVVAARAAPAGNGFAAALALIAITPVVMFTRFGGRRLDEWTPISRRHLTGRVVGRHRNVTGAPLEGHHTGPGDAPAPQPPAPQPPSPLAGVELLEGPSGVGVLKDAACATWSAVVAVRGASFPLSSTDVKEMRLAGWGELLDGLASHSTLIHRVKVLERTAAADADDLHEYARDRMVLPADHPAVTGYFELTADAQPTTQQHEMFVVLTIGGRAARRAIKRAVTREQPGADKPPLQRARERRRRNDSAACQVVVDELRSLVGLLRYAGLEVEGVLPPRLYAAAVRNAFDPEARRQLPRGSGADETTEGVSMDDLWPVATEVRWGAYRSDGSWHATYWIAEWPRTEVDTDFLRPLLLGTKVSRTLSLVLEPIDDDAAEREITRALVADLTDDAERRKRGFLTTPAKTAQMVGTQRRASELAEGFSDYRYSGYVTVTAGSSEELERGCVEVERKARQAGCKLRRLYGQQDVAFTWALPLGRGLRGGVGSRRGIA